jgi:methyl-accepting chemotaxis protein
MTTTTAFAVPTTKQGVPSGTAQRWAAALAIGTGVLLAWWGGAAALLGALVAAGGGALYRSQRTAAPTPVATAGPGGRHGAEVMVSQVVPVWSRQMEVTRDAANDGIAQLLQTFAEMSGTLSSLTDNLASFSVTAQPGAVDDAVRTETPALQALTSASQRAFDQRDAAVAALAECREDLLQLQHLAKQAREIARHTRLVAFNASIEAKRAGGGNPGGSQAVASELRTLAGRMATIGEAVERGVLKISAVVKAACRDGEIKDTTPEELRLEIDLRAREALAALLASMGASLQGSAQVHQAGQALREQIDGVFMNFQFGDRVSQMMSIVANDMSNFARWVSAHPLATQSDAAEWLATLEASYTMEEQRSHHHGNVHVERSSGVEFF